MHTMLFARLIKSRDKAGALDMAREGQALRAPIDTIKDPYVLDFLDLPEAPALHESQIESAIIAHLQEFLLELGKGFAFVARQKRLSFEDEHLYVDLVFYNCILKCYVLVDLKIGRLTHQDVGQMDGYVRLFDDRFTSPGDNPTIGLILCAQKNDAVARYSVLSESKQIFAAKYLGSSGTRVGDFGAFQSAGSMQVRILSRRYQPRCARPQPAQSFFLVPYESDDARLRITEHTAHRALRTKPGEGVRLPQPPLSLR